MNDKKKNLSKTQKAFIGIGSSVLIFMLLFMRTIPEKYVPVRDSLLNETYGHKMPLREVIKSIYPAVTEKQLKNDWEFKEQVFDWGASCTATFNVGKNQQLEWRGSATGVQQCKQIKEWQPYNALSEELYTKITGFDVFSEVKFPVSANQTSGDLHLKVLERLQGSNKVPDKVDSYKVRNNDMVVSYDWNPSGKGPTLLYGKTYDHSDYSIQYTSKSVALYLNSFEFENSFKEVALLYLNTIGKAPWERLIGEALKEASEFRRGVLNGVNQCGIENTDDCNESFYVSLATMGMPWWDRPFKVVYHRHPATESNSAAEYVKIEFERP